MEQGRGALRTGRERGQDWDGGRETWSQKVAEPSWTRRERPQVGEVGPRETPGSWRDPAGEGENRSRDLLPWVGALTLTLKGQRVWSTSMMFSGLRSAWMMASSLSSGQGPEQLQGRLRMWRAGRGCQVALLLEFEKVLLQQLSKTR